MITQKDLLYVSRDPDVLIYTVLVPLVIYPIIFIGANDVAFWIAGNFEKQVSIVAVEQAENKNYKLVLDAVRKIPQSKVVEPPNAMSDLRAGKLDAYVTFDKPATVHVNVAQSNIIDKTAAKIMTAIWRAHWDEESAAENKSGMSRAELRVFDVEHIEIAPSESKQGEFVPVSKLGGLPLPLMMLIGFIWIHIVIGMGPPATIVFAEHREKKTIETTLLEPVARTSLVGAKFSTVWLIGIGAGVMYTIGIALTVGTIIAVAGMKMGEKYTHTKSGAVLPHLFFANGVTVESWLLLTVAIIVNTAICAIFYLIFAARANTFKQAQALITIPMMVLIMLPLGAFLPGMELNMATVFVPAMNLFLVLKRGEPNAMLTAFALAWDLVLILGSLYFTRYLISIEQGSA